VTASGSSAKAVQSLSATDKLTDVITAGSLNWPHIIKGASDWLRAMKAAIQSTKAGRWGNYRWAISCFDCARHRGAQSRPQVGNHFWYRVQDYCETIIVIGLVTRKLRRHLVFRRRRRFGTMSCWQQSRPATKSLNRSGKIFRLGVNESMDPRLARSVPSPLWG